MKIPSALLASVAIAGLPVMAQTPQTSTPHTTPSPMTSPTTPNPAADEVMARRKLEDAGYKDIRGLAVTPDGKITGMAVGPNGETKVEVDSTGAVGQGR